MGNSPLFPPPRRPQVQVVSGGPEEDRGGPGCASPPGKAHIYIYIYIYIAFYIT